jgi:glycosyltransferase involved in cell wall biosynthesis
MGAHKVLHIITRLIVGGAQENTMFTAALLDPTRYQVDVVSGPQTGSEGSLIEEVRNRGIPLAIVPELVRQIAPFKDLVALVKIYRMIRKNQYHVVHTHSSKAGIIGRLAAFLARTPVIIHTVHGWSFHDHMPSYTRNTYIALERIVSRITDAMIVVTDQDIQKGINHHIGKREKYHLIRSAIPLDDFMVDPSARIIVRQELKIPDQAPVVGNVGRFSAQKNPLDWIKVAALVKKSIPNCYFLLVGDGPLRDDVDNTIDELNLRDCTILTGLRRDVSRLMSAMDIFLLTSLWEGLPRVIPQAMLMRLPVIVTGVDGSNEAIKDNITGFVCAPGDLHGLATRCIDLLQNRELRNIITSQAYSYALNEFDLRRMISDIDKLYSRLLTAKQIMEPR